jgi:hypothetical protein
MRFIVIIAALLIGGCATSTGVLPAGPDTYTITEKFAPIRGGSDEAEKDALSKASDYCAQKGREFVPNNMGPAGPILNPNGYTVTFRCLLADDPAVKNYRLGQAPNIVVEQRNR